MNINQIPPWKTTTSIQNHVTESCDQNSNSTSRSSNQSENKNSTEQESNMNDKNSFSSPSTRFTIRSSVFRDSPCNGDAKLEENDQNGDESERISFSAAFNLFESSTLPKDNKNKRNFSIPKHSPAKANAMKDDSDKRTHDSSAVKSPNHYRMTEADYYTFPGSPKKSSTSIILSPSSDSLQKNGSNSHSDNETSAKESSKAASPKSTDAGRVTIRAVSQAAFRSHGASRVPSPPPQASFSPSNNIEWPLRNKDKYVYLPVKKSQGSSVKSQTSAVTEPSSWREALSPVKNNVTGRLDNNGSDDQEHTVTSSVKPENEMHNDNDAQHTGSANSVSTNKTILKSEITGLANGQKSGSSMSKKKEGVTPDQKTEIHVASAVSGPPSVQGLTNGQHPTSSPNEETEASLQPVNSYETESTNQKAVTKEKTNDFTNHRTVIEEQINESTSNLQVSEEQATSITEDVKESKTVPMKSTTQRSSGDANSARSGEVLPIGDEFVEDEKIKDKLTLKNWDPRPLLDDLYQVKLEPDIEDEFSYVNMEGYMEKLPTNKKKATLLKTWKRRYFKAKEGKLYYFETRQHAQEAELCLVEAETAYWEENSSAGEKASAYFQMMGGSVEELGGRMLGIDDGRGRYLVVRCPTDKEYNDWLKSLNSQINGKIESTFVKPVLLSTPHGEKKIVIIDIGSCSVRAGILGEKPSLPSVFFPTVVAIDKKTGEQVFGFDCYKPNVRATANLSSPVRPSSRMDKSVDMSVMSGLFRKIYNELGVNPRKYWVMFSAPGNLSDKLKEQFMDILIKEYLVPGINIVNQTLLALYSYNAKTGIVVDIGDRLEIVPITDGYVAEGGVTRQPYGGHRIAEALKGALTERKYHFFTEPEYPLVRLIMEKLCFVSKDFNQDLTECNQDPKYFLESLSLEDYNLPEGYAKEVSLDWGRFKAPEGLFNTEVWGMDNPPLQKLVQKAVQASPLDSRREMWRSIYLSGGATVIPGFAARLQAELSKIAPSTIVVQVHASPQRYHAAYIGACTLASLPPFERSCITSEEWNKQGAKTLKRWHMY